MTSSFNNTPTAPLTRIGLLPILLIMASGCSSGSDGNSPAGSGDLVPETDPVQMTSNMRLKTRITDRSSDDIDDLREVFEYDEGGNVILHTIVNLTAGSSQVIVFDYATDGRLLTKTDGQDTDSYSYEDGRLVSANRVSNGMLSYRYDDNRLVGVSGEGFFFDDDCVSLNIGEPSPMPQFEITYIGDQIALIDDTVNLDTATVTRDDIGRLQSVVYSGECYEPEPQRDEYTFDTQGHLINMFIEGTGYRDIDVVSNRYESGLLVEVTINESERGSNAIRTQTVVKTYDEQRQLVSDQITADDVDIGTVSYTYEEGNCLQPGSADPSNVINVESARLQSARQSALLCGYWFDERDF